MNHSSLPWIFLLFLACCIGFWVKNASKKKRATYGEKKPKISSSGLIVKYEIPSGIKSALMLPANAEIIDIKASGDAVHLWAVVPENEVNFTRTYHQIPTGECVPENSKYVGTAYFEKAALHIFEVM